MAIDEYRVKSIIGIPESELVGLSSAERESYIADGSFVNSITDELTSFGDFSTPSVQEMRDAVDAAATCATGATGATDAAGATNKTVIDFEVRYGVDISVLTSQLKTTDRALVQVASNFNCLEVPSLYMPPNWGGLVEKIHKDETQGPAACCGPLSGCLYRAHFYRFSDGQLGQTGTRQIELLSDFEYASTTNGKLRLTGDEKSVPIDKIDKIVGSIKCGLHRSQPVLFGRNKTGMNYDIDEPQMIDQVFNASINMGDIGKSPDRDELIKICRTLLRAAYESAYLCAILGRNRVLYLTMVGGGVFGNPEKIILEEMVRAHRLYAHKSVLEKVVLCIYDSDDDRRITKAIDDLLR